MCAMGATVSANDAIMCAKGATLRAKDATMSGKDATIASMCGMAAPKPPPGRRNRGPGEMYADPGGYPPYPEGPRSLHFRRRRPIPGLPKLASNCVRPAAALRDLKLETR